MSTVIDKIPHSCGTKQGLNVFLQDDGTVNGFCFACPNGGKFIAHPYGKEVSIDDIELPSPKTPEEIQAEIEEVHNYPVVDIPERKLRAKYLQAFGVKVSLSELDGVTPTAIHHPITKGGELTGYYVKTLGKNKMQWSVGEVRGGDPYNWENAKKSGAYRLIIFEGREDAIAAESVFDRYGDEKYKPAIIALPNGTNSVKKCMSGVSEWISRNFREIIICMDNDKAGKSAEEQLMQIFPKALSVELPEKDMNDCLIKGAGKAAYKALSYNAAKPKNSRVLRVTQDLLISAREPTPWGSLTWPWPTMNDATRNIRTGETIYVGGGVKMSKSEIVNTLGAHFITEDKIKVFMAKPEEAFKKTIKMVVGKVSGNVFHDPKVEFNYQAFDNGGEPLVDNLYLLDLYQHMGWETLKSDIIHAASEGCKAIFIDPITNLTSGMNPSDANTKLQEIARDLSAMAKDLDVVIFIFCHLKAPDGNISADQRHKKYENGQYYKLGNCPHERGGDVLSNQFAGSRAMMQSCNLMIGIGGNKDEDLPEEIRNMRYLTILEDREFGNSLTVPLFWNKQTQLFTEV